MRYTGTIHPPTPNKHIPPHRPPRQRPPHDTLNRWGGPPITGPNKGPNRGRGPGALTTFAGYPYQEQPAKPSHTTQEIFTVNRVVTHFSCTQFFPEGPRVTKNPGKNMSYPARVEYTYIYAQHNSRRREQEEPRCCGEVVRGPG